MNQKVKHTPGPWHWQTDSTEVASCSVREADGRMIARLLSRAPKKGYPPDFETMKSDARLIAAAPDLLAACEEAIRYVDSKGSEHVNRVPFVSMRAAIAKARGEG